jgi:hypothetical protein
LVAKGAFAANTTVACIGEQTTFSGDGPYDLNGAPNLALLWPGVLQTLLGTTYTVTNDVTNNGNTISSGNCVTAMSKAGPPDIVIIGPFAEHDYTAALTETAWQADYQKVVNEYLALTPAPTVYVMTPPPKTFVYQNGAAEENFATDIVLPAVKAVQMATAGVKLIDLSTDTLLATSDGDGHFTVPESAEVAKVAYGVITGNAGGGSSGASSGGAASGGTSGAASGTSSGSAATGAVATTGSTTGTTGGSGTSATGTEAPASGSTVSTGMATPSSGATAASGAANTGATSGTAPAETGSSMSEAGSNAESSGGPAPTPKASSGCAMGTTGSPAVASLLSFLGIVFAGARKRRGRRI